MRETLSNKWMCPRHDGAGPDPFPAPAFLACGHIPLPGPEIPGTVWPVPANELGTGKTITWRPEHCPAAVSPTGPMLPLLPGPATLSP